MMPLPQGASAPRPRGATPAQQLYRRLKPGPGRKADAVQLDQRERIHRAMIEIVADGGYEAVTVRKLTKLAGVSTSAFYAQFDGKDDCFVATYKAIMDGALEQLASTRSRSRDRRRQLRRSLRALAGAFANDPDAAHLALVEAYAGGPAALDRIREQETDLDLEVKGCLDRRESHVSPITVGWINAGFLRVTRTWALGDNAAPLDYSMAKLLRWALPALDECTPDLPGRRGGESGSAPVLSDPLAKVTKADDPADERELILAAVRRLARSEGYWGLSIARIRSAAGVSRAGFNRHFSDVEHCFLVAIRDLAGRYLAIATSPTDRGHGWAGSIHQGVLELCEAVAADPETAKLAFSDVLVPGVAGVRCKEDLTTKFAEDLKQVVPPAHKTGEVAAEATAAALWSVIDNELDRGRGGGLPAEAATYSFFLLASAVGADAALAALAPERDEERGRGVRTARVRFANQG